MILTLLNNTEIDKAKWDKCIADAVNGRIYGLSWYLDTMCPDWSAIVSDDYKFIMPLPVKIKWGIRYVFQPAFMQQLGIFSVEDCTIELTTAFIEKIKKKFKYAEINFNAENDIGKNFSFKNKKNYLLSLSKKFEALEKAFSRSAKRNIIKALDNNITIEESAKSSILLNLHQQRYGNSISSSKDLKKLEELLIKASEKNMAEFFYAKNSTGKYIASSGYLKFKNRIIFLVNGNIKEGLETGATHLLKEHAIKKFSNSNLIMDFEGSETSTFARFYEQYGAEALEQYSYLKFNNLPKLFKRIKK